MVATLRRFADKEVQFIHLTGAEDQNYVFDCYRKEGIPAYVSAFYNRMEEIYTVADFAVARSGAFVKNQQHLALLEPPQTFFQTAQTNSFTIDRNSIERIDQPAKRRKAKQRLPRHIVQSPIA